VEPILVTVVIAEPVPPTDRRTLYIQPVVDALVSAELGKDGGSAGTRWGGNREIDAIDFTLQLDSPVAIALVTRTLEELGAPQGSRLIYEHDRKRVEVPFGIAQTVAVFIDTSDRAALAGATPAALAREILAVMPGEYRWGQPCAGEYGLYFYGVDAEKMFAAMRPVLHESQVGRTARVVIRHGGVEPREVRIE
jgi:hypothetical protein